MVGRNYTSCAKNRLHDHSCDRVSTLKCDLVFKRLQAELRQFFWIHFVKRITVSIRCGNMKAAGQQGFVGIAKVRVTVDGCASDVGAMIPFFKAQEFCTPRFTAQFVILSCEAKGCFDAVRPTRGKECAAEAIKRKEFTELKRQFDGNIIGCAAESRIIRQRFQLL